MEIVRNVKGTIFANCVAGQENVVVCHRKEIDQPQLYIRAHLPFKVSHFGSPIILISVLDHNLSEKLVNKGHIQANKQAQENLNRISE